ncbi:MAG: hypothetical protein H0V01_03775 [Bacteroidetes bacterium]|nr:hypothetical protein [Bacteroidota bacterium]HET6245492.1 hypothetical protein [Bacteroidia bacterium]
MRNLDSLIVKVIEVEDKVIKYKKFTHLDGPIYHLNKSEINEIKYKNGEKDYFNPPSNTSINTSGEKLINESILKNITKKGNTVCVISDDYNVIVHANNLIQSWGFWKITSNKNEADFILRINIRYIIIGEAIVSGQFIDSKSGEILRMTNDVNSLTTIDLNAKRGAIKKLFHKEIKPYYY